MYKNLTHFRFWCQKVLPLVYDDSLSYYEILCKSLSYIHDLIENDKIIYSEIEMLKSELLKIQKWIDDFDTSYAEEIIKNYLATMIFVALNDDGYIVYYIPENWNDIKFQTTGLDITIPNTEYGRLVLCY